MKLSCLLLFFVSLPALSQQKTCYSLFEEAKQIVQEAGIKTNIEYKKLYKEFALPSHPDLAYKAQGWEGWKEFLGTKFPNFEEAKQIAQEAGIKTSIEYREKFRELALPASPHITYKEQWSGWKEFLGTNFPSYEEAKQIVQEAGIKTNIEYKKLYKEFALPSHPDLAYKVQGWEGWKEFLGTNFPSFEEAKQIVQEAGIKTNIEYKKLNKELALPSHPDLAYKVQGWQGWREFLGTTFSSFEEAKQIAQEAGIKTQREYKKLNKELGLPSHPDLAYKDQWPGWREFLGTSFPSFEKAKRIAQEAGIKTQQEYKKAYKELDLPANPHITYKAQGWLGYGDFLGTGRIIRTNFPSLDEAKKTAQSAGIKTKREYQKLYKELGLPSAPYVTYKAQGWLGYGDFLGTGRISRTKFPSFETVKQIAQSSGIKTKQEYQKLYKELGLPASPHITYKDQGWQGWREFLGTGRIRKTKFPSFEEAKQIAQGTGIKTQKEYKKEYKKLGLPSHPDLTYKAQGWRGYRDFLGKLPSFEEAQKRAQEAGIKSSLEYRKIYKELALPSIPDRIYKAQGWKGWGDFLGTGRIRKTKFPSFEEARQIAQEAGIQTNIEYRKKFRELALPASPHITYKAQGWEGWREFLGTGKLGRKNFPSFEKAKQIVQEAGIKTSSEYKKVYKSFGLHSSPRIIYKAQGWKGWGDFLGIETKLPKFEEAKLIAQSWGIKTEEEYRKEYKELKLPYHPYRVYKDQWKGWIDFLGTKDIRIKNFPNLEKAKQIAQEAGIKTILEYKKAYKELGLPSNPNVTYKAQGWSGWKHFLGTEKSQKNS